MMWRSVTQLAGLPGMPASPYHRRELLDRLGATRRERAARGGGSEYLVTDLPEATQQALAAQNAGAVRPLVAAMEAGEQARRDAVVQAHADSMARLGVTLQAAGAFDPATNPRLDLFQRFEAYHRTRGGAVWPAITEFCALWDAGQIDALPSTRGAHPALPAKTLDKWYRAWRTTGVEALLTRKPRKDKGQSRLAQDEALHEAFVAALSEMHDPTARQVHRVLLQRVGIERAPALRTVKTWLLEYRDANKVALLKVKNPDAWRNRYMPAFGSRSEHITFPNEEWQLDSTIADAQQRTVVEMAFRLHDADTGEIRRHALVAAIDVFTRRAKVLVSRTSSSNAVKAVVRRAVMDWGLPTRMKTDNGKDYTAQDFDFGLQALNVQHLLCTPFSPDQKPFIERFLGTLLHDLFPMLNGYVGHDVATRKGIESGLSFAQRFGHEGMRVFMTPEQLQGLIDGWLDEYHARVHSELRCSPAEMAERHTTHVRRIDDRALDLFLMPVAGNGVRTVGKRGIQMPCHNMSGTTYYRAPELARPDVMGRQVYCRIDEADVGAMHVFALDGSYICRALDHSRLGINRAELAAKTRALESATVKPLVDELRKAKRKGLVEKAVGAIFAERQDAAVDGASNVTRLQPRVVMDSTAATESVTTRPADPYETARAAARAALDAEPAPALSAVPAPVVQHATGTPKQLYSAWVRLSARAAAGEQLAQRDTEWMRSYEGSTEFDAWHAMQAGEDPLEASGG